MWRIDGRIVPPPILLVAHGGAGDEARVRLPLIPVASASRPKVGLAWAGKSANFPLRVLAID